MEVLQVVPAVIALLPRNMQSCRAAVGVLYMILESRYAPSVLRGWLKCRLSVVLIDAVMNVVERACIRITSLAEAWGSTATSC